MQNYDAIIIGGGHNGLLCAAYLSRAGKNVLILERRSIIGGIAATEEIFPGFKFSSCAHLAGSFSRRIIDDLQLERHGLEFLPQSAVLFAPTLDSKTLFVPHEPGAIAEEIGRFSKRDADSFAAFTELIRKLSMFLQALRQVPLPDGVTAGGLGISELVKIGVKFHRLGRNDMYEFLRILPMSIADLVNEWFVSEPLKAAIAAGGLLGSYVGPRAQGTALALLHHLTGRSNGAFRTDGFVRGGIGNLPGAIARVAQRYGAQIRTGAEVDRIATKHGVTTGVVLKHGEEISATVVISAASVKATLLNLVEPTYLDPHFLLQVRNIRARGTAAKINIALDGLPPFEASLGGSTPARLGGIVHIGPTLDYLEQAADDAKYGRVSERPFLEITIPSLTDPSLAPPGKHVMSVWAQSAPYHLRASHWDAERDALGDRVINVIEDYAPGFTDRILHRQVLTPLDLERDFGLFEGHIDHAELGLDQIFFMRPVPGWAVYSTPIENLYLCGSGTHPGGGINGLPGEYAAKRILNGWRRAR